MSVLSSHQWTKLGLMVLIIGEALIYLSTRQAGETSHYFIHGRSGLRHRHHVMHTDPCAFHHGMARTHTGPLNNVTVAHRDYAGTVTPTALDSNPLQGCHQTNAPLRAA